VPAIFGRALRPGRADGRLSVSQPKKISTMFSQLMEVGVKCS
jgi:hypothetical protein